VWGGTDRGLRHTRVLSDVGPPVGSSAGPVAEVTTACASDRCDAVFSFLCLGLGLGIVPRMVLRCHFPFSEWDSVCHRCLGIPPPCPPSFPAQWPVWPLCALVILGCPFSRLSARSPARPLVCWPACPLPARPLACLAARSPSRPCARPPARPPVRPPSCSPLLSACPCCPLARPFARWPACLAARLPARPLSMLDFSASSREEVCS
jgi:hypothetical protein